MKCERRDGRRELRVLVLWADPEAPNFGLRVIATGTERLLRTALEGADCNLSISFQDFGPELSGVAFGTRGIVRNILTFGRRIGKFFAGFDLIVDTGAGDSFTSIYGAKRLIYILHARLCARRAGVPVIMGPQTIGPFEGRVMRRLGRWGISACPVVISRDPKSSDYALNSLRRGVDFTGTDVVFTLPYERPESATGVVVNVSGLLWFGGTSDSRRGYQNATVELIRNLRERGYGVKLLAHVVGSKIGQDDAVACEEARKRLNDPDSVSVIVPGSLAEVRRVLSGSRLVVASRMHVCLNAISQGVPAIAWAYSRKFKPLFDSVGWDSVIDISSGCGEAVRETMNIIARDADSGHPLGPDAMRAASAGRMEAQRMASMLTSELGFLLGVGSQWAK